MKYKARIFFNTVEELELEANSYEEAKEKAFALSGEGKTFSQYDFMELDEMKGANND
jgi:hypothetical protein